MKLFLFKCVSSKVKGVTTVEKKKNGSKYNWIALSVCIISVLFIVGRITYFNISNPPADTISHIIATIILILTIGLEILIKQGVVSRSLIKAKNIGYFTYLLILILLLVLSI